MKGQPEFQSKTSQKSKQVTGGIGAREMKARKFNPMTAVDDSNNFWPEYGMDTQSIHGGISAQMNSNEFVAVQSPDAKSLMKKKIVMPTIQEARGTSMKKGNSRGGVIEPFKRKLSRVQA